MILLNSRYTEKPIVYINSGDDETVNKTVFRSPPVSLVGKSVKHYMWRDGDRIDIVSTRLLSDPQMWWKIMDINPEIVDPQYIEPGTIIRIPK